MSESSVKVSVVLVVHNSLPALRACLVALAESVVSADREVICVDNASTDRSMNVFAEFFPHATAVRGNRNRGFAAGCNLGAGQARGDYLLFLNPDVIVEPTAIGRLVDVCAGDDRAGLVSGRLRNPDGTFQPTCRRLPTMTNLVFSRRSALNRFSRSAEETHPRYTLPDSTEVVEVPAVAATMVMIRKTVFQQVGGFDERFFMFMEDTDLSLRVRQAGYHNLFVPRAGGVHLWGAGGTMGRWRRLWHHHRSVWQYFRKHRPGLVSGMVLPFLLAGNYLVSLAVPGGKGAN